ncbi:centromere protein T-like isoform X1 [Montipora capricornis]|uniref:centromere protein T-like isoform X1 n=1 Tax=Montipora capricornis TaxID=246305 RepID=UPI0035F12040
MEEATPRGMIRGVLTTASISKSSRKNRNTPRAANDKDTPANHPSHSEIATRILTRSQSRSLNKKKAAFGFQTPTDLTTPRTLIAGYLQAAPVAASAVCVKKQVTVTSKKDANETLVTRQSNVDENNTPRTIIQNLLHEGLADTPVEPILSADKDDDDDALLQASKGTASSSPITSITDEQENSVERSLPVTTIDDADDTTTIDATTSLQGEGDQESQELGVLSSLVSEHIEQTDALIRDDAMPTSRQWKDLVTPELPLDMSSAPVTEVSSLMVSETQRYPDTRPFFGGKPSKRKVSGKTSKKPYGPKMPSALVKNIFQHFSTAKVSKEALQAVELGSNLFFKQLSSDLMTYCQHSHRSTIELADVELLMKRQGFITNRESLYSLVEKYLPLEYREEIIPTVQAGNKILLK